MTRQEFIDSVTTWNELLEFCNDYGCDVCEDIIDDEEYDDYIEEDVSARDCNWSDLRDYLNDVPSNNYYYYLRNGWLDYQGLNDGSDFREYKDRVLEGMDDWDDWDDDDEEEEEIEPDEEYDVTDFDVESFVTACQSHLQKIYDDAARKEEDEFNGASDAIDHILASI